MLIKKLKHLGKNQGFKKYFFNTSWLLATQGVRLFVGFFVGLWIARYLEPSNYGVYNYVIAIISIFVAFVKFGTEDVLVKNLILHNEKDEQQLNTAFYLRLIVATLSVIGIVVFYLIEKDKNSLYILICSFTLIFQSFEVIDIFYRAKVKVKLSSAIRIIQILISSALKVFLILQNKDLITFFYVFFLDALTYSIPIYLAYTKNEKEFVLLKPNSKKIISLAIQCFPVMMGTILTIILSRVEHFIIAELLGNESLGIFVSAFKIVEIVSLIPVMILASLFTAIINAKHISENEFTKRFKTISKLLMYYSIVSFIILYLLSEHIIHFLYGDDYLEAGNILKALSFHCISLTLMLLNNRWLIAEDLNKVILIKMLGAVVLSIGLNLTLIPIYGIKGAVISTIIAHTFFFYVIDFFFTRTRTAFSINSAFLTPWK